MRTTRFFNIGTYVRLCGGVAEHYPVLSGRVVSVCQNGAGLPHLNKYLVQFSQENEEWFYEFQLSISDAGNGRSCA